MQSALLHNDRGFCIGIAIFTREGSSDLFLDERGRKMIVEILENKLK